MEAIVVGGGITGLCAAHYLQKALGREQVLVLEAAQEPGGSAQTDLVDGYVVERGPNGFLDKEPKTLQWVEEVGLKDDLLRADEAAAHRFILRRGRLHEVRKPPAFFLSPLLSRKGRARLLCEPFIKPYRSPFPETVWEFAARRLGREAADVLMGPMVSGIYAGDARQLSVEQCFPRLVEMERTHGSLLKALRAARGEQGAVRGEGKLTCFYKGIGHLMDAAGAGLGDSLQLGCGATRIERTLTGWAVTTGDGEVVHTERLILATPAHVAAELLHEADSTLAETLADIPYVGVAVLCTGYRRAQVEHPLNGFGFLVPRMENRRALGCLWSSSIFPHHAPKDHVLLRTMYGGAGDPSVLDLEDRDLMAMFQKELGPLMGLRGDAQMMRVYRWEKAIPQYDLGHARRLEIMERRLQSLPGLALAGNAYRGVGLNDCVVSARGAVERVLEAGQ